MELDLEKISNKSFVFVWNDVLHQTKIQVSFPDLKTCSCSVWGDWSPMYAFDLAPDNPLFVSYNGEKRKVEQKKLRIESPIVASERDELPFVAIIEDEKHGFKILLYLNPNFELAKVVIERIEDRACLFEANGDFASVS